MAHGGECSGRCEGYGSGVVVKKGKCPKQPDDDAVRRARRRAEREAKHAADARCRAKGGEACRCAGSATIVFEDAETQNVEGCGELCVYSALAHYSGECTPLA